MAGVYEKLTSGKKDAVAAGGGVSFVPEDKGVYAKIARENQGVHSRITQEKPSDPIYDQWKLEQQMREEMERVRQERLRQQKEEAVKAGAPAMAMQPVVTAAQVAVEQVRKNQEAAQERAAKSMWKGAQRDIHAAISTGNLGALEGLANRSAEKREVLDTVRDARTETANRQAAPERYDNAVTLKGTELQESYSAEAMAKGAKAAGNPLVDFEGYVEDRRKATGQSPAAMFGVAWGADGKGARAADFLSTLSGKEREYIDYLYGTYDRQKAAQLLQAYLTNRANEQPALQPQVVDAAQQADNAVQQADKKTMGRNAGKVPVYIQSHLQDAQRGANINNNAGGVVAGMLSKPAYAVETVAQSVRNLAKGTDLTAPLYSEAALGVADSKAAEERFLKNFENKKLQWVAGVGLSIANSAANRLLGPLGKFMMGLQAMGGDAYDLAQEGEDATTILVHSALAGIAESAAESISWGRLDKILNGMPPKTFRGLLKTVSAQMATEFGEEAVTEGVNILTDWATRGENSTIAEVAAQAKEDGREHPGWYTAGVMAGQIALAGLAGAFSGGIMGGSALALNAMRNKIGGNAAKADGQAVDLTPKTANAAGNDAAQVKPEGMQNAAEPGKQGTEETPKAAAGIRVEAPIMAVGDEKDAARMNAFIPGSAVVQGEENAQETVADFAQTAADQMPAEGNTQNSGESAEKKPPVNWRARNIDAEEDLEAVQPLINAQGQQVEPKAIDATDASVKDGVPQQTENVNAENAENVPEQPQMPSRPANKRSAESRARDAARELHAGKDGATKILQTIQQMDAATMTPEMRRVVAQNVAKELVKEGPYISKEFWESFAPLRDYLRKTEMHIDPQTLGEIKAMGLTVTSFNQKYGTRLTTKNVPGNSLDGNMAQWAPLTNGMVQADEGNAFDALVHTLDTMRQGKAGELDKHGMESAIDGAAEVLLKYADETMEPDEPEALDKKDGKKPEIQSSTSQEKTQGTGWEKFEDNRIAQAMHHKPEGAVANMGDAERVRHAEEEIAKARKTLQKLEEDAQDGEVRTAEGIAKGEMTLQDVSPRFSVEKVARMAEQLRLIKQWEEQGITGQRKGLHETQFKVAEELMEGADDSIFEHDPKGAKGIVGKRRMEFGKLLASTSERVMHRVFDGKIAQKAIEEYIRPAERNEAAKIMAIGRLFDGARELKLNRYESTMVQLVGEGLMQEWNGTGTNPLWKNGQKMVESLPEYARENPEIKKLAENLGRIDPKKITKAVEWYRKTYKDFHAMVNDFRLAHGMPEIGSIENYFPHFSQDMDGDMLNRTLKSFGIEQMGDLPASIAGRTAGFRPVSRWVGSFQKRTGPQTVFDAEQGFQMYANAVMDMLYHTDDIMRIRHLEWVIRQRSREQEKTGKRPGIEERLKQTKQMLEDPAQLARIEEIMEAGEKDATGKDLSAEYSGFVQWLQEYGNKLANKGDTYRFMERILGRRTANMMNKMLGNYGAAQIVGNVRSALANTAVLPKMVSLLSTKSGKAAGKAEIYIGQALWKMARGEMRDVYGRSEFMSSKKGVDPLVRTAKDRHSNAHMILFNAVEDAMSKLSFTAGYVQAQDELKKSGKSGAEIEREVIQRANDFAAQVMSRRDKTGASLLSRSREPIVRLAGMFQTEIANEWQTFTQDMPREAKVLADKLGKKKAAAVYGAALARYLVYSNVLAYAAETVLGVNPFNDWLAWIADLVRDVWEEPEEEGEKGKINFEAVKDFAGEAAGTVPYISGIAAMLGYTNDRVPVGNVLELIENAGSIVSAQRPSGKIEGAINAANVAGQLVGLPGAGQYAKSLKGIIALADGGKRSQKTGQLQDVWQPKEEESWKDAARAIAFGPSAMKGVREYYDTGKAELTKKQTEAYDAKVKAGVPKDEALEYAKDIMPALTSAQLEAYDAAIGAGIHKDTALSYVKWSKGVTAKKDKDGETIPNSKRIQYLQQANEFESLTGEQRAILYQGALPSDQAKEFEEMTQKVDRLGVDMDTWMEFLERYYQIRGSGKKQRVRELMEDLELPPTTAQILGDIIGYDIR